MFLWKFHLNLNTANQSDLVKVPKWQPYAPSSFILMIYCYSTVSIFPQKIVFLSLGNASVSLSCPPPVSQGNDTDITGAGEKAESSRYSRSYTSGATLGAELRRGRSRRLSSSLQVPKHGHVNLLWVLGWKWAGPPLTPLPHVNITRDAQYILDHLEKLHTLDKAACTFKVAFCRCRRGRCASRTSNCCQTFFSFQYTFLR